MQIAFLGPEGTFTQEALETSAPAGHEHVAVSSIFEVIMAVHGGAIERGLVPIENSLEGSVNTTLDTLAFDAPDVHILREIELPIRHRLLAARPVALDEVERVLSHPHAKAQCARFLRERLPQAELVAANSTAEAVRQVAAADGAQAAIGTALAAKLYGATLLADEIGDAPENRTRFVYLARAAEPDPEGPEGDEQGRPWKTTIVCGIASDRPGALLEILQEFALHAVNLTKLESRPAKTGLGAYVFFMDLEGRRTDGPVDAALQGLEGKLSELRILGSYPVG